MKYDIDDETLERYIRENSSWEIEYRKAQRDNARLKLTKWQSFWAKVKEWFNK